LIQVRSQYDNVYVKILDKPETFEYTLEKIRLIPGRGFNMDTGEWMFSRDQLGYLLLYFGNQISWMTPLREIVKDLPIDHELVSKHLKWESENEFKNFKMSLYPYQKVGANFLIDRGCGAIFDGCGLGKTPQLIGACEKLFELGKAKLALIVTKNSLKRQWAKEIEKFTGKPAIYVSGTPAKREKLIKGFKSHKKVQYLVINYEMLRTESYLELIKSIPFDVVGLDEAHKIKNGVKDTQLGLEPSQIAACTYELKYIPYRFIATATPLQGKAEEVWSLFYFLDETILGDWYQFRERYCKYSRKYGITGYQNLGELYYRIAPYFIRRTKEMPEIQQQLPKAQHSPVFLEMTDKQQQIHDYLLEKLAEVKEQSSKVKNNPGGYVFINGQTMSVQEASEYYDALVQGYQIFMLGVCDSPELIAMSDSPMAKKILEQFPLSKKDLKSPKIEAIKEFYEQMLYDEPNSKVVIFSRFERMVELLAKQLPYSVPYHGQMSDNRKEWAKDQFVNNPNVKAIICTDAGAEGLNLQVGRYLIHVDLPWDPTLIEQRNGRIERTGNHNENITIYYYVMSDSYDEHLLTILERKQELANTIIGGGKSSSSKQDISKLALDRMLKNRQRRSAAVGEG
jgi:SNF2 family DNA or RNA helicase